MSAVAVREEVKRKHCWDAANFSNKHLGGLRGFNSGSNRDEIVLTSKWLDEFKAAVDTVLGDAAAQAAITDLGIREVEKKKLLQPVS